MNKRKKSFLFYLLLINLSLLNAQVVLNESDLPKSGDTQLNYILDSIDGLSILPGNNGENVYWDFSKVKSQTSDTTILVDAQGTSSYSQFPLASLAINKACTKVHSHVTHTDIETCKNDFYIKNSSGLYFYGSDVQTVTKYDIPRNIFPVLNYGDSINNESRVVYYSSGSVQKVLHIKGYSKADAWGTIKTPAGTANVVRIYTSETVFDSTYTNGIASSQTKTEGNYYYKWYAKGLGYPVFQISKGILNNNPAYQLVKYAQNLASISTGIEEVSNTQSSASQNMTVLFPNPVTDRATIKINPKFSENGFSVLIVDSYGRTVLNKQNLSGNEFVIEKRDMQPGVYIYQLISKAGSIKGKFLISNN